MFVYITNIYAYKIYMIRHGEKIDDKHIGLSKIGKIRSKSISKKFSNSKYNISKIYVQHYYDLSQSRTRVHIFMYFYFLTITKKGNIS